MSELHNSDTLKLEELISKSWEIRRSKPLEALQMALEARKVSEELNSKNYLALSYRNSGTALYILSQYSEGLEQLQKAQQLFEEINNLNGLADVIRNIGNIYHSIGQYQDSLIAYEKAINICINLGDKLGEAYNLGNIGFVKLICKDFDNAITYINKTIIILKEIDDTLGLSDALNNLGKAYFEKGESQKTLSLFLESLLLATNINHLRGIANANLSLGNYYLNIKQPNEAKNYLTEALKNANALGEIALIISVNKLLSQCFEDAGNVKLALKHYKLYEELKNKNEKENNERAISSLKYQFNFNQLELEKSILQQKNNELFNAYEEINAKNIQLELLSLVTSNTDNIILIFDEFMRLEWVNKSFTSLTGSRFSSTILSQKPTIFEMSGNTDIYALVNKCIHKKTSVIYGSSFISDLGKTIWFSSTLSPIFNEDNQLKKLVIIDADITEIKNSEDIIKEKNKDITDSINYAQRIQNSLLPDTKIFERLLKEHFIFFKPRDVVSGDFYWLSELNDFILIAAIDCTGHGVPGAMMSMIASSFLNTIIHQKHINSPALVLRELYTQLDFAFTRYNPTTKSNDGMDIALIEINKNTGNIRFAGVNRNLYLIRDKQLLEFKSTKLHSISILKKFDAINDTEIPILKKDSLYLFSDGYSDQFGGIVQKKLGTKKFKEMLITISSLSCENQKIEIEKHFNTWKGNLPQTDDILIMGIKI